MIDLAEAGHRLASTRVGPTPPLEAVRARQKRRVRRRRVIASGSVLSIGAAAVALALSLSSSSSRPQQVVTGSAVTLPPARSVAGSTPYDYQRLRLWLPAGWATSTAVCAGGSDVVYFPSNYSGGPHSSCVPNAYADRVVVVPVVGTPFGSLPQSGSFTQITVNGINVEIVNGVSASTTWYVPSLQVELIISGIGGKAVADTLEPSALQDVLTATYPAAVPTAWKTITFDGFQAQVPPDWPTNQIIVKRTGATSTEVDGLPNVCGPPEFAFPSVHLGAPVLIGCPPILETKQPPTGDGLWLQPPTNAAGVSSGVNFGPYSRLLTIGHEQVVILPGEGDSIQVAIYVSGKRIAAVIGLGPNPAVAQAILSSIAPTHASPAGSSATSAHGATTAVSLPPGVLSRSIILGRYPPPRPGITVQAKLVTLASLAQVDPDLTQCSVRGCAPGQYVWLILEQGPPGSFPHSELSTAKPSPQADAWALFPVDAATGAGRGDSQIGAAGQVSDSAWGRLDDLAS